MQSASPHHEQKNPTIVYLRVSTVEQETDSQEHQVLEYCRVRGWQEPRILRDSASGATTTRPGLETRLARVKTGGVHQVVTYKLDRLGRSIKHLAIIVGELQMRNVALICTSQWIDTSTKNPVDQLQLGVLMAVAEFERALIKERTIAGLEVARRKGKRIGRPPAGSENYRTDSEGCHSIGPSRPGDCAGAPRLTKFDLSRVRAS